MGNFSTLEETRDRLAHVVYAVTWAPKNANKFPGGRCQEQVVGGGEGRESHFDRIFFDFFCLYGTYIYLFTIKINDSCRQ